MAKTRYDNAIKFQQIMLSEYLVPGMTAADMTMGNGSDTKFILDIVGLAGKVYAFDIQAEALSNTKHRLGRPHPQNCMLILDSHANCDRYIKKDELELAVFNLGYLPGGDRSMITKPETTITALEKTLILLKCGAPVYIVSYKSHDGGKENNALCEYLKKLDQRYFNVILTSFINQKNEPPDLIIIEKRKDRL